MSKNRAKMASVHGDDAKIPRKRVRGITDPNLCKPKCQVVIPVYQIVHFGKRELPLDTWACKNLDP